MTNTAVDPVSMLDRRDQEYIAQVADPQLRATIIASLSRYRRTTPLQVGDKLPSLALTRLVDGHTVQLEALIGQQPLCLIFGSYT
jgi:hypothetical protein